MAASQCNSSCLFDTFNIIWTEQLWLKSIHATHLTSKYKLIFSHFDIYIKILNFSAGICMTTVARLVKHLAFKQAAWPSSAFLRVSRDDAQMWIRVFSLLLYCSAMAKHSSAPDLCSHGRVWVQILATTVGLVSLSKTLHHTCFSPPRSKNGYL